MGFYQHSLRPKAFVIVTGATGGIVMTADSRLRRTVLRRAAEPLRAYPTT